MKKINRAFIKGTNWALAGIMGLIGFTSCSDKDEPVDEYGVPWSSYAIKGAVKDKTTGEPIEGIEVKIAVPDSLKQYFNKEQLERWKTHTDKDGVFKLSDTPDEGFLELSPIVASDIDNEKNGLYKSDTTYVDYKNAEHIGGGNGWFQGELTKTIQIGLEEEKKDE